MKIRDLINEDMVYKTAETEIREWVETSYPGLSIEFNYPTPEVVQIDQSKRFTKPRVRRIVEAVNIKIGDILEAHAEEIYLAGRLDKIYARHPDFSPDVETIEDIKKNKLFLKYLKELSL